MAVNYRIQQLVQNPLSFLQRRLCLQPVVEGHSFDILHYDAFPGNSVIFQALDTNNIWVV